MADANLSNPHRLTTIWGIERARIARGGAKGDQVTYDLLLSTYDAAINRARNENGIYWTAMLDAARMFKDSVAGSPRAAQDEREACIYGIAIHTACCS